MKTMSTLPTKLYAVAIVGEGVIYSRITGPYSRHHDALTALNRLNGYNPRQMKYTIISTPLIWNEDTE